MGVETLRGGVAAYRGENKSVVSIDDEDVVCVVGDDDDGDSGGDDEEGQEGGDQTNGQSAGLVNSSE